MIEHVADCRKFKVAEDFSNRKTAHLALSIWMEETEGSLKLRKSTSHYLLQLLLSSFENWAKYIDLRHEKRQLVLLSEQHQVKSLKAQGLKMLKYFVIKRREAHSRDLIADFFCEGRLKRLAIIKLLQAVEERSEEKAKVRTADTHYAIHLARLALQRMTYFISPSFTDYKSMCSTADAHHATRLKTKAFESWMHFSVVCKHAKEMEMRAIDFFRGGLVKCAFCEWADFVEISKNVKEMERMAAEFAAGGLAKWAFGKWQISTALSQRSKELHRKATLFFLGGILKRLFSLWLVSIAISKQERSADQYRRFILSRKAFDALVGHTEVNAIKAYLLRKANNRYALASKMRALEELKDFASKSIKGKRLVSRGFMHYSRRLAKRALCQLSARATEVQNTRLLSEDADCFMVQRSQQRLFSNLSLNASRRKQNRLFLLLADRHRARFATRKAMKKLRTEGINGKRIRRNATGEGGERSEGSERSELPCDAVNDELTLLTRRFARRRPLFAIRFAHHSVTFLPNQLPPYFRF